MKTLFRIGLVVALCALAMLYLLQRNWSLNLTRREARLDKELRVLCEKRDSLRIEVARLGSYARMAGRGQAEVAAAARPPAGDGPVALASGPDGGGR